jgi:hypothetical protein
MSSKKKSSVKKQSVKKTKKAEMPCAKKGSKKGSKKKSLSILDETGFYTWNSFVKRWREREQERVDAGKVKGVKKGTVVSFRDALSGAGDDWVLYKERNGIEEKKEKKQAAKHKTELSFMEFVKQHVKGKMTIKEGMQDDKVKAAWEDYKTKPKNWIDKQEEEETEDEEEEEDEEEDEDD